MCDNKNEIHDGETDDDEDETIRLELDLTATTDTYPEFDYLELVRNKQLENKKKKAKNKVNNHESENRSHLSTDDSEVEALAKMYEEKYGNCDDYAELGEGYDEEDSFIDNTDAINDLVPNGIQTAYGGFYINRGKLSFVKEDNSSSSTSEDVDKFLAQNRLNVRRITSDDENEEEEAESSKAQSNNSNNNNNNINNSSNNNNNNNNYTHPSGGIVKSRKRSGEFTTKSKKIRKTATPKIPDHLLNKKPFSGSSEFEKNINEIKKNRLKNVEADKKLEGNNASDVNNKKEISIKKKPTTVKELLKERDGASEVIEAVATGADLLDKDSSSSSDSSESSSSDSESDSSEDGPNEKDNKIPSLPTSANEYGEGKQSGELNEVDGEAITAKTFAHLNTDLKDLIEKINQISKEEKNKLSNSKLNSLLLSLDDRLRDLPAGERNNVLDHLAIILQMKKESITKRTKKLLLVQEESKMTIPLRKLKEAVGDMMPRLESNYFKEFTKAAGTSPQIYAELSRYYWSIDPGSLPARKFPWDDELRTYLKEIIHLRKNCYYITRPRKESVSEYVKSFLEAKVKPFWPKDWMTVDILWEEGQSSSSGQTEEKQKVVSKIFGTHNAHSVSHTAPAPKKSPAIVPTSTATLQRKQQQATTITPHRKLQKINKNLDVKSILVPKKTPSNQNSPSTISKPNYPTSSTPSSVSNPLGIRLPSVSVNKTNVQDFFERNSASYPSLTRTTPTTTTTSTTQQISPNRTQQPTISPTNRNVVRNVPSPTNQNSIRPNFVRTSSPNSINKAISSFKVRNNSQSVLKTIEIHSGPVPGAKNSPNSVTISPVTESMLKDISPSPEVLNLTKNSSLFISKVTDSSSSSTAEPKPNPNRSNSPSIGIPLPSGITISPTNATTSTFLTKPQKPVEKSPEVKINVSLTKQDPLMNAIKEKSRESVLNMNYKRENPLQHIPDCISVTSKVVSNEKPKYEHVRKRALQEYHQLHSPERLRLEESKKVKNDDVRDDKLDEKNFTKMYDSLSSEMVRKSDSEDYSKINTSDRYSNLNIETIVNSSGLPVKNIPTGHSQLNKNNSPKLREVRLPKEKPYMLMKNDNGVFSSDDRRHENPEDRDRNETTKEQLVQMEMEKVMQNLVELSRERAPEYDVETQSMNFTSATPPPRSKPSFPEVFQKMLFK